MTNEEMGRTEAVYREVNEAIAQTAERVEAPAIGLVCECGDAECTERVTAELATYERVRAHPTQFILMPGHERPSIERVVEEYEDYAIVEKTERDAARVARQLDPRGGDRSFQGRQPGESRSEAIDRGGHDGDDQRPGNAVPA